MQRTIRRTDTHDDSESTAVHLCLLLLLRSHLNQMLLVVPLFLLHLRLYRRLFCLGIMIALLSHVFLLRCKFPLPLPRLSQPPRLPLRRRRHRCRNSLTRLYAGFVIRLFSVRTQRSSRDCVTRAALRTLLSSRVSVMPRNAATS